VTLRGKDRAALRREANRLSATVHVGHNGVVSGTLLSLDDALRTHELVKVQLSRHSDKTPKVIANELAEATDAEVVQVIGRTATFYRFNPELEHSDRA
jgi:RNA-binding protein